MRTVIAVVLLAFCLLCACSESYPDCTEKDLAEISGMDKTFWVEFKCKNCGHQFVREYPDGADVHLTNYGIIKEWYKIPPDVPQPQLMCKHKIRKCPKCGSDDTPVFQSVDRGMVKGGARYDSTGTAKVKDTNDPFDMEWDLDW